jgi:hypothetical protein
MNRLLFLNKDLYDEKFIRRTISDFSHIATISIYEDGNYWRCAFENTKASINRTIYEFENYLIAVSNQRGV